MKTKQRRDNKQNNTKHASLKDRKNTSSRKSRNTDAPYKGKGSIKRSSGEGKRQARKETLEVTCTSNGVCKYKNDTIHVPYVLKGETAVIERSGDLQKGKLVKILKPSSERVEVKCPIYERCGGCSWLHLSYANQLKNKQKYLKQIVNPNIQVEEVMTSEPYGYRNKVIVGFERNGREVVAGLYEDGSHRIVPYKTCLLHDEVLDGVIQTLCKLIASFRIELYQEDKRKGFLRHVLLRIGKTSGEVLIVFVTTKGQIQGQKKLIQELRKQHPSVVSVVQNINERKTSVVLGDTEQVLYGPGFIYDTLCGLKYRISSKSFYQINHDQTEVLYETAIKELHANKEDVVLDAYCGIGTIGLSVSKNVKRVIGVEVNQDAIRDAHENAKRNQISNISFVCDDATEYMLKAAQRKESIDVVILDPPRSGTTPAFIASLAKLDPQKVLYISCNPETQVRDLGVFKKYGYYTNKMIPVDMFPNTNHVESIVLLQKR